MILPKIWFCFSELHVIRSFNVGGREGWVGDSSFLISKNNFIIIYYVPQNFKIAKYSCPQSNKQYSHICQLFSEEKWHQASIKSQPGHDMITDRPKTAKQYSHPITQGISMGKFNHTKLHLHYLCMGILFNSTAVGIHLRKTLQIYHSKMRLGDEICLSHINMLKGISSSFTVHN